AGAGSPGRAARRLAQPEDMGTPVHGDQHAITLADDHRPPYAAVDHQREFDAGAAIGGAEGPAGELPHLVRAAVDGRPAVERIGELDADRTLALTEPRLHAVRCRAASGRASPTARARAPRRRTSARHRSTSAGPARPRWRLRRARPRPVARPAAAPRASR